MLTATAVSDADVRTNAIGGFCLCQMCAALFGGSADSGINNPFAGTYTLTGSSWVGARTGTQITWSFASLDLQTAYSSVFSGYRQFTTALNSSSQSQFRSAFDEWEAATGIDFVEVSDASGAQIRIGERFIDGTNGVVGQAQWWTWDGTRTRHATISMDSGDVFTSADYRSTALHEIGHTVGLGHSSDITAIMYFQVNNTRNLTSSETSGTNEIYGPTRPIPRTDGGQDLNNPRFMSSSTFTVTDAISASDRRDVYQFVADRTGTATVTLTGLSADLDLYLMEGDGWLVASSTRLGSLSESATMSVVAGSAYLIDVSPFLSATSSFTLTTTVTGASLSGATLPVSTRTFPGSAPPPVVTAEASPTPTPTATPARPATVTPTPQLPTPTGPDAGNILTVATPLTLPQTGTGLTQTVGGTDLADYFSFTVSGPGSATFALTNLSANMSISLLGATGNVLASGLNPERLDESIEAQLLSAGTYYLWIRPAEAGITGQYTLTGSTTATPATATPVVTEQVFRFFNTTAGFHFYTSSVAERDNIQRTLPNYRYEGVAYNAPAGPPTADSVEVFRFFNTQTGAHFFTSSTAERDSVRATLPHMNFEGTAYRAFSRDLGPQEELYRFFNTQTGVHFFTATEAERDAILVGLPHMRYEGIAFYIL